MALAIVAAALIFAIALGIAYALHRLMQKTTAKP